MGLRGLVRQHVDVVIAAVFGVVYTVELLGYPNAQLPMAIPAALAAAACLAVRRRAPFAVFLAVSALNLTVGHYAPGIDANSISFLAVFAFNLYSLGAHARGVEAVLGVVGVIATVTGFVVGDGAHGATDIFFALVVVSSPWAAGVVVRLRGDRERELRARNLALQEEAARAVVAERSRIARELHDVVSHAIAVTVLQARGGKKLVGRDDETVRRALAAIEDTNTAALNDMRRLLALLRDTEDDHANAEPAPSLARLDHLVEQVRESGLPVDVEVTGEALPLPPGLDLSAYRIVQEALTNVLKHAGPEARASVHLAYGADDLEVSITNTGATNGATSPGGHGLIGIRERVAVAGGRVEAGPANGGYAVRARLPYLLEPS